MWANLEIILSGTNTITMKSTQKMYYYRAINASTLIFSGNGTLNIKYDGDINNRIELRCVDSAQDITIKENATINIECSAISPNKANNNSTVNWEGLYASDIMIDSNAQLNINYTGSTEIINKIYGYALMSDDLIIYKNGELNINLVDVKANTVEFTLINPTDYIQLNDNAQINIKSNNISADDLELVGLETAELVTYDNANLSVDLNNSTGKGYQVAILTDYFKIDDNSTILANATSQGNTLDGVGLHYSRLHLYEESIIKCYGNTYAFIAQAKSLGYPLYGGNKKNDVNHLTHSKITYNELEYLIPMYGDTPAKYAEIGYLLTINLDCSNGTVNKTSLTMHNGHAIGTLPTPISSRKDYTFAGWYTAKTGGTKVYSTTKLTKSTTLYAQWKKITYNITLNANGGSVGTSKIVVQYNGTLGTLEAPTRTGYTFTGWYTAKSGGTKVYSTTKPTKSMTLYAQWKINTYTIKFDGNGGTVGVEKKWVDHGNAMEFMPTPTRTGYTFTGWFTAKSGGNKVYSTTKVTKNMTLYAQWKLNTYTIKFDGNGGTVGVEKKWVDHGNAMNFMPTPTRTGYTFTGWYTAKTGGSKVYTTTKVTKNMTLYAQWKKK